MPVSNNTMSDLSNMFGSMDKMLKTGQVDQNYAPLNAPRTSGSQATQNIGQQNVNDTIGLVGAGGEQSEQLIGAQNVFGSAAFTSSIVAGYWALLKQLAKNIKESGS